MYMQNHRCKVTGSTSTKKLGTPKPAAWCRQNPSACVSGPKQMMAWNREFPMALEYLGSSLTSLQSSRATMSRLPTARRLLTTRTWVSLMVRRTTFSPMSKCESGRGGRGRGEGWGYVQYQDASFLLEEDAFLSFLNFESSFPFITTHS